MVSSISYLIQIIYTQLYGFKYSYLIQIILLTIIWSKVFLSNTNILQSDLFGFVWFSLFNRTSTFIGFFNANAILVKQ